MQYDSPIPDDFNSAIDKWRQYAQHKNL
jgi:hypothetical protein